MKQNAKFLLIIGLMMVLGSVIFLQSKKQNIVTPTVMAPEEAVVAGDEQVAEDTVLGSRLDQENNKEDSETPEELPSQSTSQKEPASDVSYMIFYGETCPYCHDVQDWMKESNIESILDISMKEVYNDTKNAEQMKLAAQNCGLANSGVPFLYTSEKECIVGSTPIIEFLSEAAGI